MLGLTSSCFVNDVAEATGAQGEPTTSSGEAGSLSGPGPSSGGGPSTSTSGGSAQGGAPQGGQGGGGAGTGPSAGGGGQGGASDGGGGAAPSCGDGTVNGDEDCDVATSWCVDCTFQCNGTGEVWNAGNGHCYRFVKDTDKGFDAAESDCVAWRPGAHLVSITSQPEQDFVAQQAMALITPFESTYLGGRIVSGQWTWVSGEAWGFTHWDSGEGNVSGGEDCLGMYQNAGAGPWHDFTCSPMEAYICEWTPSAQ